MLVRAEAFAKPTIIGQISQPSGALVLCAQPWENRLVANQRRQRWQIVLAEARRCRPRPISTAQFGELLQTNGFEPGLHWQIFAKRHQMVFVAALDKAAIAAP